MDKQKILIVDDEADIIEFLTYNLEKEGYDVHSAVNGIDGIKQAKRINPELIILDIMMPEMDGIETCEELRKDKKLKDTIIVFLTARNEDYSQIAGFDAGGDDFVSKPVNHKVLISRIKALLKRDKNYDYPDNNNIMKLGNNISIDRDRYQVIKKGKIHILPKKEFELLSLLASIPEKVFTREEIYDNVWGDSFVGDRTIDVHIRKLREKLGKEHIITIKGVGYKFID